MLGPGGRGRSAGGGTAGIGGGREDPAHGRFSSRGSGSRPPPTVGGAPPTAPPANGGGFVAGATGTDYSQQDAPQVAVTDAVANGTTTITSDAAAFATTHVGNIIYLAG